MIFNEELMSYFITAFAYGLGTGVVIGFISWGLGFAIYGIIKAMKMA